MANINGNIGTPTNAFNLQLDYTISQNVANNYSNISEFGYVKRNGGASPFNSTSDVTMQIDIYSQVTHPAYDIRSDGYKQIGTYAKDVGHNSDGSKNIVIGLIMNGKLSSYYPNGGISQMISLPTIPRNSKLGSINPFDVETEIIIPITKFSALFTDNLIIKIENTNIKTINNISNGYKLKFTTSELNIIYGMMSNTNKINLSFELTTVSIGTTITMIETFISNANPIFTNFDYQDINAKTISLTNNNKTIIKNQSNVNLIVDVTNKAISQKGSEMSKYTGIIGTKTNDVNYSSTLPVNITLNAVDSNEISIYAIDSRGNTKKVDKVALSYINYNNIDMGIPYATRQDGGSSTKVKISVEGNIFIGNFGIKQNSIKSISYKYKNVSSPTWIDGTSTITPTISNNKYYIDSFIIGDSEDGGFLINESYNIEITLSDELSTIKQTTILQSGSPAIALYGNSMSIGGSYDETNGGRVQGIYDIGDVYLTFKEYTPEQLKNKWGGSWELIAKGQTLVGVNTQEEQFNTVKKIGGNKQHKHNADVMRAMIGAAEGKANTINYVAHEATNPIDGSRRKGTYMVTGSTNTLNQEFAHYTPVIGYTTETSTLQPYITCYIWEKIS